VSGSPTRLAVVKRANQGTGLEIVHQLAEEGSSIVLIACNTMCDVKATRSLKKQHRGLNRNCGWTWFYKVGDN
jgi:NAD(P)-dependent dehydrogenase (short-subunit alcohol dehydrogenase family)